MSRRLAALTIAALVLSAAGGAYAANRYLITSVRQIKPSVRAALRGSRGPAGPAGPAGASGSPGLAGPAGVPTTEFEVTGTLVTISPGSPVNSSQALCPVGDLVLSGGWKGTLGEDSFVPQNAPTTVNGAQAWDVVAALEPYASQDGVGEQTFQAVALCAK